MEKKYSKMTISAMRKTAENVFGSIKKRNSLLAKVEELNKELEELNEHIKMLDTPTVYLTGGYGSEDLFDRVVIDTGKTDKNGCSIKITKYVLKYPETVVPPTTTEEINDIVENETENVVTEENNL